MSKTTTPKPLAPSPTQAREIDSFIERMVETICLKWDDKEQAAAFLTILDLCTNDEQYSLYDRHQAILIAKRHAFTFTEAFDKAMEVSLRRAA